MPSRASRLGFCFLAFLLGMLSPLPAVQATPPASPPARPEFDNAFGINPKRYQMNEYIYVNCLADMPNHSETDNIWVRETGCSVPANILWPGDKATLTVQIQNKTNKIYQATGKFDLIHYQLTSSATDAFFVKIIKLKDLAALPVAVNIPPKGYQDLTLNPPIPVENGGYALILDLPGEERLFVATLMRTFHNLPLGAHYRMTMDNENVDVLQRLGLTCNRIGGGGFTGVTDPNYEKYFQQEIAYVNKFKAAGLPVTVEYGANAGKQPLPPEMRHYLKWDNDGKPIFVGGYPGDMAWLPQYDKDFKAWVKRLAMEEGWPKGPISAMKLWNEPWEGDSCAGWGADMLRYREMYTALCEGVEEARKEAGVQVMLGGCDSTSNTYDKLFPDGSDAFLQRLDFMSIHYQGLNPNSTVKMFVNRKNDQFGRVQIWDTESWCANSDDRVTAVLPSMFAAGYDHVVGVHGGCVVGPEMNVTYKTEKGNRSVKLVQAWSVGAAVGATQHFVGNREFDRILYNGLPFIYLFNGMPGKDNKPNPEDGTAVIVGDIGRVFGEDCMLFRTVHCLDDVKAQRAAFDKLAALPVCTPERATAERNWNQRAVFTNAGMILDNKQGRFSLYDYYGNPVPGKRGKTIIPLNDHGFFLRGNGKPGSYAALVKALQTARVEGMQPVEIIAHDPTAPIDSKPAMILTLHNVLPQPVSGKLTVVLGKLTLSYPTTLSLAAHEAKDIAVQITAGDPVAANAYPLNVTFDTGKKGQALHAETLHANVIARRPITVDGDLKDWDGVLPQTILGDGTPSLTMTEIAWKPYTQFDATAKKGLASGYLAYDDQNFYYAAKIADNTPDPGTIRVETRNDDEFFYPEKVYLPDGKVMTWPAGVRRYTYAKTPVLPAGNAPNFDNVQLAFNVLSEEQKPWYAYPKGTLPHFVSDWCSDYEYALNKIADQYGGGTEIWRMKYPGMPNKHFYPRQPKSPLEGPVKNGQLVMRHDGNTRIVECAIPWTELPDVKKALDAGKTIKFSFRVNDDAGVGCMELARYRSVANNNPNAFKVDWTEHWGTEVEFGFAK